MNTAERTEFFERAVAEVIERSALENLLESGRSLRMKQGFDPTRPNLHLGHVIGLRKLRQVARWGHQVIVIVGDWTAQTGDPSDREDARPGLAHEEVLRNAETYREQFHRIVPHENVRVVNQSEWFGKFTLRDVMNLAWRFTAQQMLAREEFRNRQQAGRPIPITDLMYPILQAYDSIAIQADVEFGGTDQKFNILLGRELQAQLGQAPQQVFLVQLLPGLDGEKMSKTKHKASIWLTDSPAEMFGKVMSLRDDLMPVYFEWAVEMPLAEARRQVAALSDGSLHARDAKELLARQIVTDLHGPAEAEDAAEAFRRQFRERRAPETMPTRRVRSRAILDVLVESKLASSRSAARRLIEQRGVHVDERVVTDQSFDLPQNGSVVVKVGRKFARIETVS